MIILWFAIGVLAIFCLILQLHVLGLQQTVIKYEKAIRTHRDQHGDDRCWMDDEVLYETLPEGYIPPLRDTSVEIGNCQQFINCRHNPRTMYVSPEREIERLKKLLETSQQSEAEQAAIIKSHLATINHLKRNLAEIAREKELE